MHVMISFIRRIAGAACLALIALTPPAQVEIPDELFTALGLERNAAPNVLYDAIIKRYRDEAQGAGKGKFGDLWEPIPFSIYMNPRLFHEGPEVPPVS